MGKQPICHLFALTCSRYAHPTRRISCRRSHRFANKHLSATNREKSCPLKLHLATSDGRNAITGYGTGYVEVNGKRYETSLVVQPASIETDWKPGPDRNIGLDGIAFLATLKVDIVLIGTGVNQHFPPPATLRPLIDAGVGFEIMDTNAACRTYNILVAEDRRVAAALQV
jgi:uncharacterized protein